MIPLSIPTNGVVSCGFKVVRNGFCPSTVGAGGKEALMPLTLTNNGFNTHKQCFRNDSIPPKIPTNILVSPGSKAMVSPYTHRQWFPLVPKWCVLLTPSVRQPVPWLPDWQSWGQHSVGWGPTEHQFEEPRGETPWSPARSQGTFNRESDRRTLRLCFHMFPFTRVPFWG